MQNTKNMLNTLLNYNVNVAILITIIFCFYKNQ